MHVPEIIEVKEKLESLKVSGLLNDWELPYENLLTRRSAAIFFFTPNTESSLSDITNALASFENSSLRPNEEKKLSKLAYRLTFSKEEKAKNAEKELIKN
jgi:hypothetical protein